MNSAHQPFIHYSFLSFNNLLSLFNKYIIAWKPASYFTTTIFVTLCNYHWNKVSPPLWQSVSDVVMTKKQVFLFGKYFYNHNEKGKMMNSQTTIHRHYSFSNLLKTNMIEQIMNGWIVFLSFSEMNFKILPSLTSVGFSELRDRVTSHLSPLTTHL